MIISLVNQKGGVGKTTAAINIASAFSKRGSDVLIVDADPQASIVHWRAVIDNRTVDVVHRPDANIHKDIEKMARNYDHVVIDSPPASDNIMRSVLVSSEMVIIPVTPSALDIWSARNTIELVKGAGEALLKQNNRKLACRILISKKIVGTKESLQARDALKGYGIEIFKSEFAQRIVYARAMTQGLSALQFAPKSEAADEIRNLYSEIIGR